MSITWSLERDQVIQVGRLCDIEKFEGEIENFILNTFIMNLFHAFNGETLLMVTVNVKRDHSVTTDTYHQYLS